MSVNYTSDAGCYVFICRLLSFCYCRRAWPGGQRVVVLSLLFILSIGISGCQRESKFDEIYQRVSEPALIPGMEIPRPNEKPILTVSGLVGVTNQADTLVMDRNMLEAVGTVAYRIQDPFEGRPITFSGVLMRDLLALWQVDERVQQVRLTALNDYQVTIPVEDFYTYPILLALRADGKLMDARYRGPVMLVYPLGHYEFDIPLVRRRWIWQIRAIELL